MLTVKHVAHGQEHIYAAPFGVTYVGPRSQTGIGGPHLSIPKAPTDGNLGVECKVIHSGHAYVMNEAGSTIGSYELGEPPLNKINARSCDGEYKKYSGFEALGSDNE